MEKTGSGGRYRDLKKAETVLGCSFCGSGQGMAFVHARKFERQPGQEHKAAVNRPSPLQAADRPERKLKRRLNSFMVLHKDDYGGAMIESENF